MRTLCLLVSSLAGLALASGCGSSPSAKSCQRDQDCSGLGVICVDGDCQRVPTVRIVSPAGKAYTNSSSTLHVTVEVTLATAAAVQLWVDGSEIVELTSPPFEYSWDTSALREASHFLEARVLLSGHVYKSDRVEVIVDRQPPTVEEGSRVPAPGASNVWSRDPITVSFSEPILPPPPGAATVAGSGGTPLSTTSNLSADGTTLTITPASLPEVPSPMLVTLTSAITDLAGNGLVVPADEWKWDLPQWQDLGVAYGLPARSSLMATALTVDAEGAPVLAVSTAGTFEFKVIRWAASSWLDLRALPSAVAPGIGLHADAAGRVGLSWVDGSAFVHALVLSATEASPTFDSPAATTVYTPPAIAMTSGPDLQAPHLVLISWISAQGQALAWELSGHTWAQLGSAMGTGASAAMAAFDDGAPCISWLGTTYSQALWSGTAFGGVQTWDLTANQQAGRFAMGSDGTPFLLAQDGAVPVAALTVSRAVPGTPPYVPAHWSALGTALNIGATASPSNLALAIDMSSGAHLASGDPVAAWSDGTHSYVVRHSSGSWVQLGVFGSSSQWLAVGPTGVVALAQLDGSEYPARIRVKRFNR